MKLSNFSEISKSYEKTSIIQNEASEFLFELLKIQPYEDVLDLGCGPGHITQKIKELTNGIVIGVDPSEGMITQAREKYRNIEFLLCSAENINFQKNFDVIFCNSTFQWFENHNLVLINCFNALKDGGRIGIQAPAGKIYSPNFQEAIQKVKAHPKLGDIFFHFKAPWLFRETAEEYSNLFKNVGFTITFAEIRTITTPYPSAKVFDIFKSGASAGYINQKYYSVPIDKEYQRKFLKIIKQSFSEQAKNDIIDLVFNRIFLVAEKR
ncbi:MAG: methyltransferase domain-containing protein [Elusimicrobiota bacterium]